MIQILNANKCVTFCSQVITIKVPKKLSEYPDMLSKIPFFSRNVLSNSDLLRKNDYANIKKRNKLKTNSNNFDEFISNLEIKLNVCSVDIDYDRISQLFSRTNQFTLSGKKYQVQDLEKKIKMVINYYQSIMLISLAHQVLLEQFYLN